MVNDKQDGKVASDADNLDELKRLRLVQLNNEQLLSDERLLRKNQEIALIKSNKDLADKLLALHESEEKYKTLFNTIDEGFCIIEMMFDAQGRPYDWKFIEVNPAFEQNNGLKNATGKTILELTPDIEPKWFDIYGKVAKTGQALRFEENSVALNRAFSLYAFPTGAPEQNHVAVIFRNTTDRKRREANLAFLAEITQDFALLSDAELIMQTVSKKIGDYLNITTCNFTDVDENHDLVTVHNGWNDPSVPSTLGSFRLSQYLSNEFKRASRAGETIVVTNTQTDPRVDAAGYAALKMHSFVSVPFHNQGKWTHFIAICDSKPREWKVDEVQMIEEIANRIFPRLERARAEDALLKVKENHLQELEKQVKDRTADLNQSRDQLQSVLDTTVVQMSILEAVRDENNVIFDFRIMVANKELQKETGQDDLVGKLYATEYPGIKQTGLFDLITKVIATGETQQLDYFYAHEGFNKWYASMFVKFGDGVVASNIDITSRKQAEEERFKNYVLLQQTENVALLGSWDYDLLTEKLNWSDGMYKLFNLSKTTEIKPEVYSQYATTAYRQKALQLVQQFKSAAIDFEEILEIQIDGSIKAIKTKATVVNSENGLVRLLGVDMDITESLANAEKMRQLKEEQQLEIFRVTLRTEEEERRRIS